MLSYIHKGGCGTLHLFLAKLMDPARPPSCLFLCEFPLRLWVFLLSLCAFIPLIVVRSLNTSEVFQGTDSTLQMCLSHLDSTFCFCHWCTLTVPSIPSLCNCRSLKHLCFDFMAQSPFRAPSASVLLKCILKAIGVCHSYLWKKLTVDPLSAGLQAHWVLWVLFCGYHSDVS